MLVLEHNHQTTDKLMEASLQKEVFVYVKLTRPEAEQRLYSFSD